MSKKQSVKASAKTKKTSPKSSVFSQLSPELQAIYKLLKPKHDELYLVYSKVYGKNNQLKTFKLKNFKVLLDRMSPILSNYSNLVDVHKKASEC